MRFLSGLACVYCVLTGLRALLAWLGTREKRGGEGVPLSQLTVLQAVLSGDALLHECLEKNVKALEGAAFVWLIDEDDAEALRIVEAIRAAHPLSRICVEVCPPCPEGCNPKVWKLVQGERIAETDFVAVLDDDTYVTASSALQLLSAAQHKTLATGLPFYRPGSGLPSALLAEFVNNNSAMAYLGTASILQPRTINGMGFVIGREALNSLGGFRSVLHELTDDLALATRVRERGGLLCQCAAPLEVQTEVRGWGHYFSLMHRWHVFALVFLRRQPVWVSGIIGLLHGVGPLLLGGVVLSRRVMPLALVCLVRGLLLGWVQKVIFGRVLQRPAISVLSELLQPVHLVGAVLRGEIRWRRRRYVVRGDGGFTEVP